MIKFAVYQPTLTDAQIDELNAAGSWSAKPEFTAYADVTTGTFRDAGGKQEKVNALVAAALAHNLFKHTADVQAESLEAVWSIGNHRPNPRIEETGKFPMKSISVGDILVSSQSGMGYYCDRMGWVQINEAALLALTGLEVVA